MENKEGYARDYEILKSWKASMSKGEYREALKKLYSDYGKPEPINRSQELISSRIKNLSSQKEKLELETKGADKSAWTDILKTRLHYIKVELKTVKGQSIKNDERTL